jgi:hypothetical protein
MLMIYHFMLLLMLIWLYPSHSRSMLLLPYGVRLIKAHGSESMRRMGENARSLVRRPRLLRQTQMYTTPAFHAGAGGKRQQLE